MTSSAPTPSLTPDARRTLGVVFLTLFIDLVGFSIIFPLFPDLLDYYGGADEGGAFATFERFVNALLGWIGADPADRQVHIVFFGGVLGSLYGLLQYLAAPVWGGLSDRFGRKPVLALCVAGMLVSNLAWVFASSFGVFLVSRVLGGVMAGNISTATAAVADVTDAETRSRGMAIVGMAFGLGFLLGPAIGGLAALVDVSDPNATPGVWGLNPFSVPAVIALALSVVNLALIVGRFRETLAPTARSTSSARTLNPLAVFELRAYAGAMRVVFTNFLYLTIFSGMEFTLVFLAADRVGFGNAARGLMFVFVGVIIAGVQGGYVRRRARSVGERTMALRGMALTVPGLLLLAIADSGWKLFAGLAFLAVGSAMVMPCLTAIVSLVAPADAQGRAVGIFRSFGSLGRAIGPILAGYLYWKLGATTAYVLGGALLLAPFAIAVGLPASDSAETR